MKKIVSSLALASLLFTGCDSFLDVNKDPNYPTSVNNDLLLPSAENFIAAKLGETLYNAGGFFSQYWEQAIESSQYSDLAEYNILQGEYDRTYRDLMVGALADLQVVIKQATAKEAWGDVLAATVLRAYTYQLLSDALGDIPYTEALKGSENQMPHWDSGEAVYAGLIVELDNALDAVSTTDNVSTDLLLGSDVEKWITFANVMKLKLYMRESRIASKENAIKEEVLALIASGKLNLTEDIKMDVYKDEATKRNPWYECNWSGSGLGVDNNIAAKPIIEYLLLTNDPRMSSLYDKSINKHAYIGSIPGNKSNVAAGTKTKDFSLPVMTAETPVYFVTVSEVDFFIAEAQLRWGTDSEAKTAYEAAIAANFELHGVDDATSFISTFVPWSSATTNDEKLALIGKQKWVALCMVNHWESWCEVRRLDAPVFDTNENFSAGKLIIPIENYLGSPKVVKRFLYPATARNFNNNTPTEVAAYVGVWWDIL